MSNIMTNTAPPEIKKWNWGAFQLNIIWGIGNKCYLPLLCLIPFFNIVWIFVCGAKGNEWAWKKGNYDNVDIFLAVQNTWDMAGFATFILVTSVLAGYLLISVSLASVALS